MQVWATWRHRAFTTLPERCFSSPAMGAKVVGGEQLSCLFQPLNVLQTLPEVVLRHIGLAGVLFQELIQDFLGVEWVSYREMAS